MGDMMQVPCWGPKSIRCYQTEFNCLCDTTACSWDLCTPTLYNLQMSGKYL